MGIFLPVSKGIAWVRLTRKLVGVTLMPLGARLKLSAAPVVAAARPFDLWSIGLSRAQIFVTSKDLRREIQAIEYIFVDEPYRTNYSGAVVVDIGAYKGYFGAYALERDAALVVSYEPAESNFSLLNYTADRFRRKGQTWIIHCSAVGSREGSGTLYLTDASLDHSTVPRTSGLRQVNVPVASMSSILSELEGRIIVKINVEGSECDIILGTSLSSWQRVEEIFVATHSHAPCTQADLADYLHHVGFRRLAAKHPVSRFVRVH